MNIPVRFKGVDYIRIGAFKKPLKNAPERERALWRVFEQTPFENTPIRVGLRTHDVLGLLNYPVYFDLLKHLLPQTLDQIAEILSADRLIQRNISGGWDILNLGAILLSRNLEDFLTLRRKAVRVIQYSGTGRIETIRERVCNQGYAAGFGGLIEYVDSLLPSNETIETALRKTIFMFPKIAIRELIANMLIHQDFSITGTGPTVEIFSDRVEITNPGESLVATDRFIDASPRSRNETMASLMRRFGICEERGSGIDKVISTIEISQLPAPLFETPPGATRSTIFAHKDLKDMNRADRVRAVYLHACLRHVMREKTSNPSLRQRFGITEGNAAIASRLLNEAIAAGMIVIEDPTAGRRSRAYLPFWAAPTANGTENFA
ncbi:MAG: MloB [Rhodobacteraceae bacterium]|nr:MloB [Paracoccaceae bacterium]MCY4196641.1 MloB [Paracoccaceae bacterium]